MTDFMVMHKAEKKYEIGKVSDEEEIKQRRFRAVLNKLTHRNFHKLSAQVKKLKVVNVVTLRGLTSQIFDRALMEPTFCETYANMCFHLAVVLPDLSAENERISFKRILLNKCQAEFEKEDGGEEEAEEEKRLKRRRKLGNIRLIGELFKQKMLTERIIHSCIRKLLGQNENPDEKDVESLCTLMSTIGEIIDGPKGKEHMDTYFEIMGQLSNNTRLCSRVRFMLRDLIELRKNEWRRRRKVEEPNKIDGVNTSTSKWPEELSEDMFMAAIQELYSAHDENEVALFIEELNVPNFYTSMISMWVKDSFKRNDTERDRLAKLLIGLTKARGGMISKDRLLKGFEDVLTSLEDSVNDVPRAAEFVGHIFARVIIANVVSFSEVRNLVYEEQGRLVETGLATNVLGSILEIIKSEEGDSVLTIE